MKVIGKLNSEDQDMSVEIEQQPKKVTKKKKSNSKLLVNQNSQKDILNKDEKSPL